MLKFFDNKVRECLKKSVFNEKLCAEIELEEKSVGLSVIEKLQQGKLEFENESQISVFFQYVSKFLSFFGAIPIRPWYPIILNPQNLQSRNQDLVNNLVHLIQEILCTDESMREIILTEDCENSLRITRRAIVGFAERNTKAFFESLVPFASIGDSTKVIYAFHLICHVTQKQGPNLHTITETRLFECLINVLETSRNKYVMSIGMLALTMLIPSSIEDICSQLLRIFIIFKRSIMWSDDYETTEESSTPNIKTSTSSPEILSKKDYIATQSSSSSNNKALSHTSPPPRKFSNTKTSKNLYSSSPPNLIQKHPYAHPLFHTTTTSVAAQGRTQYDGSISLQQIFVEKNASRITSSASSPSVINDSKETPNPSPNSSSIHMTTISNIQPTLNNTPPGVSNNILDEPHRSPTVPHTNVPTTMTTPPTPNSQNKTSNPTPTSSPSNSNESLKHYSPTVTTTVPTPSSTLTGPPIEMQQSIVHLFLTIYALFPTNFMLYLKSEYKKSSIFKTFVQPIIANAKFNCMTLEQTQEEELHIDRWKLKTPSIVLTEYLGPKSYAMNLEEMNHILDLLVTLKEGERLEKKSIIQDSDPLTENVTLQTIYKIQRSLETKLYDKIDYPWVYSHIQSLTTNGISSNMSSAINTPSSSPSNVSKNPHDGTPQSNITHFSAAVEPTLHAITEIKETTNSNAMIISSPNNSASPQISHTSTNPASSATGINFVPVNQFVPIHSLQLQSTMILHNKLLYEKYLQKQYLAKIQSIHRDDSRIKLLENQVDQLSGEINQFKQIEQNYIDQIRNQRNEIQALKENNSSLREQIVKHTQVYNRLESELKQEINQLKTENKELKECNEKANIACGNQESKILHMQSHLDELQKHYKLALQYQKRIKSLNEELIIWEEQRVRYKTSHERFTQLQDQFKSLKNSHKHVNQQLMHAIETIKVLNSKLEDQSDYQSVLEKELEEEKLKSSKIQDLLNLQKQVSHSQLESVNSKYNSIKHINIGLHQQIMQLQVELEKYRQFAASIDIQRPLPEVT
eukprot:TRINITY_DN8111_c0_g1_i1.p1 TRINITY_DN8111_c0_g1~~TRINITY_DN8111_c0_g1_i1.p1  ORF type:complete len:1030 (+),score=209.37 TRINITY_DN8111_c0_g1_i1:11-3100(+)